MNVQHLPNGMAAGRAQPGDAPLHLRGRMLARGLWIAVLAFTVAIFSAVLPVYIAQLQTPCAGSACEYQQLTPDQVEAVERMGLSLGSYATFTVVLLLTGLVVCWAVSALIIWRRPDDRMAVLVALLLVTLGPLGPTSTLQTGPAPWLAPHTYLAFLGVALLVLVFLLFPSGRFAPRWMRWVFAAMLVVQVPAVFLPVTPLLPYTPVSQLGWLVALLEMALVAVVQLYRYQRVSGPVERQQTKWVMVGLALPIAAYIGLTVLALGFPAATGSSAVYALAVNDLDFLLPLLLPLSFGFAMLRYRLWDIDRLINRALVYGALTLIMTAVFVGLVIGLQALLGAIIGQDNRIAIVLSTLAIAALVRPVRGRLQASIDRRFYRKRYDAQQTLAAFSATVRHEVNLEQMQAQLLAVVQETMQPARVSLWVLPPDQPHLEHWSS
jgi:hypothetical protein